MKYISKYSNGKEVSEAQYITEMICENKARMTGQDLHYRFWLNKSWEQFFKSQIFSANKLLSKYKSKAIINAIKNPKAKNTYSLRSPFLLTLIKNEEKILESKVDKFSKPIDRNNKTFQKEKVKKGLLSRIKEIENGD
jgi:hypothetical protein